MIFLLELTKTLDCLEKSQHDPFLTPGQKDVKPRTAKERYKIVMYQKNREIFLFPQSG